MNKTLNRIMAINHIAGILLVGIGVLGTNTEYKNLAKFLIVLGAFLCLLFHFVSYKEKIKKNFTNDRIAFLRFAMIVIMIGFVFLWLLFGV